MWYYTWLCIGTATGGIASGLLQVLVGGFTTEAAAMGAVGVAGLAVATVLVASGVARLPAPDGPLWRTVDVLVPGWVAAVAIPAAMTGGTVARVAAGVLCAPCLLVMLWARVSPNRLVARFGK